MHLEASDPTFIDVLITPHAGRNDRLDRIDRLIDWLKVADLLDDVHAAPEGRPAYRPVTMVKIIVSSSGTTRPTWAWKRRSKTGCRSAGSRSSR